MILFFLHFLCIILTSELDTVQTKVCGHIREKCDSLSVPTVTWSREVFFLIKQTTGIPSHYIVLTIIFSVEDKLNKINFVQPE